MPERPRPEIDHTREALRRHDERVADQEEPEEREDDDAGEEEPEEDEED
jgi:hypothetical protein